MTTMLRAILFTLGMLLAFSLCVSAGSCSFGECHAWVRIGDSSWSPATFFPLLHPGDTGEVLLIITPSVSLSEVFCQLHEFGTPVYEVIKGPSMINTIVSRGDIQPGINYTYLWKVRVLLDTFWINGTAPLEVITQFSQSDTNMKTVTFDVLYAFIEGPPRPLVKGEHDDIHGNISPIPIPFLTVLLSILLINISLYVTTHRQRLR